MARFQGFMFSAVLFVTASSCAPKEKEHEAFLQIDAPFVDFVSNFEQSAAAEGKSIAINDLVLTFGSTPNLNETGVCMWAENETPQIIINERIWNTLNDYDKQEVIFHELGHCVLRRIHHNSTMLGYNGTMTIAESIMYPYRIAGSVYRDHMMHYHDELFDSAKANQF